MEEDSNLLICLKRLASGQDENFTTDALAHLLRHLAEAAPSSAAKLISYMSDDKVQPLREELASTSIKTRIPWRPHGEPDVSIQADDFLFLVEVKVSSPVDQNQLNSYLKILDADQRPRKQLTLLALSPTSTEVPTGVYLVRWFDLSESLKMLHEDPNVSRQPTDYLLSQFLDYLVNVGLAQPPVRSTISEGIRNYEKKIEKRLVLDVKANKVLIETEPALRPLWDLLKMMRAAWVEFNPGHGIMFGSGKHAGGWIGWNINQMDYFFSVAYSNPERLDFHLYSGVDKDKWDNVTGDLELQDGAWRWRSSLDLAAKEESFFDKSAAAQRERMVEFIRESYDYAQNLRKDLVDSGDLRGSPPHTPAQPRS